MPKTLEAIPIEKKSFWYVIKNVAAPESPIIGIILSKKCEQQTTIDPPETVPDVAAPALTIALCFIEV